MDFKEQIIQEYLQTGSGISNAHPTAKPKPLAVMLRLHFVRKI